MKNNKAYVYILISSKDGQRYIGSTNNLRKRVNEHNEGRVQSTKSRIPLKLHAYQIFNTLTEARIAESKYKRSRGSYERAIKNGKFVILANGT